MAHFIQLNLGGNAPQKTAPADPHRPSQSDRKTVIFGGLSMVALVSGLLLLVANGCSKSEKPVAMSQPSQSSTNPGTAAVSPAPTATPAAPQAPSKPAKKKTAKKRPSTVTFADPTYGVSFRYPKNYVLKAGDEPHLDLAGLGPVQMNFVQPGGTTLVAIELPRDSYPGADISSAYFSVNVNPSLTPAECTQFASVDPDDGDGPQAEVVKVKAGSLDFDATEDTLLQSDARYYHVFQNGTCYEFGLGMGTMKDGDIATVSENTYYRVFDKLEKILNTVKIQPGVVPEVATRAQAPAAEDSKQ
ncbi:MAG: hypothetical protein LAO03_22130 [Acidobacteriia bacterium]|nr:hypothetical protein [Terriglobia bacterium]